MPAFRSYLFTLVLSVMYASTARAELPSLKMLILMPGPVITAHADEEKNCDGCHGDFDKAGQSALCLDCHDKITNDRRLKQGFHGISAQAAEGSCKSCHKDHKGRDFNSIPLDRDTFNHANTNFELSGKHMGVPCGSCHAQEDPFRMAPSDCNSCHSDDEPHRETLGEDCADCHSERGWSASETFDHEATGFLLEGAHTDTACASCHAGQHYKFESTQCLACHKVQDVHLGRYDQECDRCHSQTSWADPLFDHAKETDYLLTGAHAEQPCRACHGGDITESAPTECIACHRANDTHAGRHGSVCENCHTSSSWEKLSFDHAKESDWPLEGKHESLSCIQCHGGELHDTLSTSCNSCHDSDSVHGDNQLERCGLCHTPAQWNKTAGFDHELTPFPLEGMHAIALCQSCHQSHEFSRADNSCIACHERDDAHKKSLGENCAQCHSPNAWSLWNFDHDKQTDFDLSGAHRNLSCDSCHQDKPAAEAPKFCSGCHFEDDRHDGSFGDNCGRCHNSDAFEEVLWSR